MKRHLIALLLAVSMAAGACSTITSTPTTLGVDGAPEIIKNTFLTVARQAATLADYDATNDTFIEFARGVCGAGLDSPEAREDFVAEWAGSNADQAVRQMWSTAAGAATSSFCPAGRG
ncbi:MAG: hypothetical protein OEM84_08100 [Acidimicrobiia bacterium]|nr:hypothetical protein [Acidimicrobiia bacterium]